MIMNLIIIHPVFLRWVWRNPWNNNPCIDDDVTLLVLWSLSVISSISSPSQDILLITGSVLLFGEQVTVMQVFGEYLVFLSLLFFFVLSFRFT